MSTPMRRDLMIRLRPGERIVIDLVTGTEVERRQLPSLKDS